MNCSGRICFVLDQHYPDPVCRPAASVTAGQKAILKAFGMDDAYIKGRASALSKELQNL